MICWVILFLDLGHLQPIFTILELTFAFRNCPKGDTYPRVLQRSPIRVPIIQPKPRTIPVANYIFTIRHYGLSTSSASLLSMRNLQGVHVPEIMIPYNKGMDPLDPRSISFFPYSPQVPKHRGFIPHFQRLET